MTSYTCEVVAAGAAPDPGVSIVLTDAANPPAFENTWFDAPESKGREMLATALTALAIGLKVWVNLDLPPSANKRGSVGEIYVAK